MPLYHRALSSDLVPRAPLASVALISATALAYEVLLTRIFAIVHWHHLIAIAISLALLGYGASGTFLVLAGNRLQRHLGVAYVVNAIGFAASAVVCVVLAQDVNLDPEALAWEPSEIARLAVAFLVLMVPFFAAANCIGMALWHFQREIPRLYGLDLLGAGIGALLILLGLSRLSPDTLLLTCMAAGLIAALLGARALRWHLGATALTSAAVAVAVMTWSPQLVVPSAHKDLSRALAVHGASLDSTMHGVAGSVSVVRNAAIPPRSAPGLSLQSSAFPKQEHAVFVNGDRIGALADYSDEAATDYLADLLSALPYVLPINIERVAVLNVGTGLRVQQALQYGARQVVAVEPNPQLREVLCTHYRPLHQALCDPTAVQWQVQSARTFIARSEERFDLISLAVDAEPSGLDAMAVGYASTTEAMSLYLSRLRPMGLLSLVGPTRMPPRLSLRLLNTARQALLASGIDSPSDHIAMLRGWQRFILVVSPAPLGAARLEAIRRFASTLAFDLIWLPDIEAAEVNQFQRLSAPLFYEEAVQMMRGSASISGGFSRSRRQPVTDDRPFPALSARWSQIVGALAAGSPAVWAQVDTGWLVSVAILGVVTVAALVLIIVPLAFVQLGRRQRPPPGASVRTLIYFALIGGGFLMMEIAWIQQLQLFLGHPVYATTVVLAAFLAFAGLGSLWSQTRSVESTHRRLVLAVVAIVVLGLLYLLLLPDWLAMLAERPIGQRILVTGVMLAPLAFAMGTPFPIALSMLGRYAPMLTPWAWGINGCVSVIAAASTPLVASELGFSGVMLIALTTYVLLPWVGLTKLRNDPRVATVPRPASSR